MKNPFRYNRPVVGAPAILKIIEDAFTTAGLNKNSIPTRGATEIIRRALKVTHPQTVHDAQGANREILDAKQLPQLLPNQSVKTSSQFKFFEFSNGAGMRRYKLYVPASIGPSALLVVMLHGCTQCADDFAAGTQMNRLADQHGFLVLYPEQPSSANSSKCWNWFETQHQQRQIGEPSIIVGMVKEVIARLDLDSRRVFVSGMSAGAAMAVILGRVYPDVFAAIGAHSGLAYGCATNVPTALAIMRAGRQVASRLGPNREAGSVHLNSATHPVRTIVFSGDRDNTVAPKNSLEIVEQAKRAFAASDTHSTLKVTQERGRCSDGRSYSKTVYADAQGVACIEFWSIDGAAHNWSGGSASGSYTDVKGPDASMEMVRFFMSAPDLPITK